MNIEKLSPDTWKGYQIKFEYMTDAYFDFDIRCGQTRTDIAIIKKPFLYPVKKCFSGMLFEPYLDEPEADAILSGDGTLLAVAETAAEKWNNRLRLTEFWVTEELRRNGLGSALISKAVLRAKNGGFRALILETQSCNIPAINFYSKSGFDFNGFSLTDYSNNDRGKKEVRLELVMLIE